MFKIIGVLCDIIDYYVESDEIAGCCGSGCFCNPREEIKKFLKNNKIHEFFIVDR